ncbi:hypothetical protein ACVJGD_004307 [Bradyrhizobium sp. USDA 10063]
MPGRGTQQYLRNFEAISLKLEPLAVVNAELLFGNIRIGSDARYQFGDVDDARLIAERVEV